MQSPNKCIIRRSFTQNTSPQMVLCFGDISVNKVWGRVLPAQWVSGKLLMQADSPNSFKAWTGSMLSASYKHTGAPHTRVWSRARGHAVISSTVSRQKKMLNSKNDSWKFPTFSENNNKKKKSEGLRNFKLGYRLSTGPWNGWPSARTAHLSDDSTDRAT